MTGDPYERALAERLGRIAPGAYERLPEIGSLPEGAALLREILETGCLSQHMGNIEAARRAVLLLPPEWVAERLPEVASACLFREREWQEWEFRRAAELLAPFPEASAWLADYALGLKNPEVDEAIEDLAGEKEAEDVSTL